MRGLSLTRKGLADQGLESGRENNAAPTEHFPRCFSLSSHSSQGRLLGNQA